MRQRRWLELVKDCDCKILYHLEKANVVADVLSWQSYGTVATLGMVEASLQKEIVRATIEIVTGELASLTLQSDFLEDINEKKKMDNILVKQEALLQEEKKWKGNAEHQRLGGLLQPQPIPVWKWEKITMDFVVGLPVTIEHHDAVWVVVDRLSKSAHFIPVKMTYTMDQFAKLYMKEIIRLHGLPISLVSDRDPRFT
ncbi:uncharacterized protein LOC133799653 [Humulus lupulus]|uniref:uncharacterized protein LOC133799653 n=1 Tax=Humulus lupulus TaxID=3486 RepID=UPI002B416907|nr:uncharacterized protein LOC133799653 [Humulus lupulus]